MPNKTKKLWTSNRKAELIVESFRGKKTIAELCREHEISQSLFYEWKNHFIKGGTSGLKHNGKSAVENELEKRLANSERKLGELLLKNDILDKAVQAKFSKKKELMNQFIKEGYSISRVCEVLRYSRSHYYHSLRIASRTSKDPVIDEEIAIEIHKVISQHPWFGYRRVWAYLKYRRGVNVGRNKVHRIMKLKHWQAKPLRRPSRHSPVDVQTRKRHEVANPKEQIITDEINLRWATDLTKVYVEEAGWMNLIPVIDCCSGRILSFSFSDRGRALEALGAVEDAVITRFGSLVDKQEKLKIRTDNGSIFLAKDYRECLKRLGIAQEFTPYHCPSANGVIERWNKTFKEECAWCHSFQTINEAEKVISSWIDEYNRQRMHSRLGYLSPIKFEKNLQKNAA